MEVTERAPTVGTEGGQGRGRGARRAVFGALAGGLAMFAIASAMTVTGTRIPVLGAVTGAAEHRISTATGASALAADLTPGSCLTWQRPDASDARELSCASPHLFEVAGVVALRSNSTAPFPDDAGWRQMVDTSCTPVVTSYLRERFDPHGRYRVGALKPTQNGWTGGDRVLRCGLQSPGQHGALFATTGHVAGVDQSDTHPAGTCLGLAGTAVGDPVGCEGPHAVEVAGVADLAAKFPGAAAPSVADQDGFLQPTCTKVAQDYLGAAGALDDHKLTVYWPNLAPESWAAGTRRVDCNLAAQLPGGAGFAPLSGSARREVRIGSSAPPPPGPGDAAVPPDAPGPGAPGPGVPNPGVPNPGVPNPGVPNPGAGSTPPNPAGAPPNPTPLPRMEPSR